MRCVDYSSAALLAIMTIEFNGKSAFDRCCAADMCPRFVMAHVHRAWRIVETPCVILVNPNYVSVS
jgi:hypothetical protein